MIWTFWGQRRFGPGDLFVTGAPGAFYDPSDLSTLFQDAAGTTPVTAVEQPVGLMLDRSRGLVLGSELVSNGDFSGGATGWTLGAGWTINGGQAARTTSTGASNLQFGSQILTVGRTFVISVDVIALSGTLVLFCGDQSSITFTTPGLKTVRMRAAGDNRIYLQAANAATTVTLDNISVRELPGAHATAPNDAARPTLRARYNLLTQSDDLTSYSVAPATGLTSALNATTAPNGAVTARRLTNTTTTEQHRLFQNVTLTAGAEYTYTVYLKNDTAGWAQISFFRGTNTAFLHVDLATGALGSTGGGTSYNVTSIGDGWYRVSITATAQGASGNIQLYVLEADSGTVNPSTTGTVKSIFVWGAQLMHAADQTATGGAYQRVGAATDYATGGVFRPYLAFDGTDDSMSTASVDFSGTDEMSVFAGVTKLSDAAQGSIIELTTDPTSVAGSFAINGPGSAAAANYVFRSGGTAFPSVNGGVTVAAPITNVVGLIADISADQLAARINGAQTNFTSADQGTGNFANAALFIGSRNNASLRYNGRVYSLIVLGRTATAAEITATESWVNSRTGAY